MIGEDGGTEGRDKGRALASRYIHTLCTDKTTSCEDALIPMSLDVRL